MASTGLHSSAFHRVSRSSCASNNSNSFSVRNILNLSEEKSLQYAQNLDDGLPSCPVLLYLPQLPQVPWPMTHLYNVDSHCTGLINRQQFRGAQHDHDQRSLTDKKIHLIAGVNVFPKKRRRPMQKKKQRPLFSPHQIQTMEKEFATQRYVTEEKRAQLALTVNLTEAQVKTWFQNRRTKWKKERKEIQQNMNQTMRGNTVFQSNCAAFGFV
ncbi:homeobox protein Hox-B7-B-like isoform X2 [Orbicella faveolata]|uniref:homeobox protein Hox-B7-B-like isoform X2 n=1 Tax=Orbicella faveolata TaxID=48498 RepID=UPI0009E3B92A|nr:homeobox protein Hox-B7-B-like isoform X2 [Orbicella faveolata]